MEEDEHPLPRARDARVYDGRDTVPLTLMIPAGFEDWRMAMDCPLNDLFSECNLKCLLGMLLQVAGRETHRSLMILGADGNAIRCVVLIKPDERLAMQIALTCKDMHDRHEHISDEVYWTEVDVHLQRMWRGLSLADRIGYVQSTNTPDDVALLGTVSDTDHAELWTHLYQEMGL